MKDAYWFKHDSNARRNPQLIGLRAKYGWAGYGLWWAILEALRETTEYRLKVEKEWERKALVINLSIDDANGHAIDLDTYIKDCVEEFELLNTDGKYIWSDTLIDRMEVWDRRKETLSEAGKKGAASRWGNKEDNDHPNGHPIDGANGYKRRGEERRGEESDATSLEREILNILKSIPHWGFDYQTDLNQIREVATDYPLVDILEQTKALRTYLTNKPLTKSGNPRLRFRNWMKNATKFGHTKKPKGDDKYILVDEWVIEE